MDADSAKRITEAIEALITAKLNRIKIPSEVEDAKDVLMDALIDAE